MHKTPASLLVILLMLTGCSLLPKSGGYYQDDGPGSRDLANVSNIPDAVPRNEPLSASGNKPYVVNGKTYYPLRQNQGYRERGVASWYGKKFHGRRTSSGESYDMYTMTAAHRTLPLPSYVRVRNLTSGQTIVVRVNDRGPFLHNRIIDLSYAAAAKLGIAGHGTGLVEIESVTPETPAITRVAHNTDRTRPAETTTYPPDTTPAVSSAPMVEIIPAAAAADTGVTAASSAPNQPPRLYLQVGAFTQWDNAIQLRNRLERAAFRPIFIQSVRLATHGADPSTGNVTTVEQDNVRVYRVRIGPLASVEEGDRLTAELMQHGIANPNLVVE